MDDLISVIVPIYKVEKYLEKCIDSIMSQSYKNLEIILVDDGSPDDCPRICDFYEKRDERIRVIHKKNGGLSEARNYGLDIATGQYVMFVDSDDYIHPDMVAELYAAITSTAADMAICNLLQVDENGTAIGDNSDSPIQPGVIGAERILTQKLYEPKGWYWVVAWNKLYKAEVFSTLRFPVGKQHEDVFIMHKILMKITKVAGVSDALYFYVQRKNSITNERLSIKNLDRVEAYFLRAKELSMYPFYREAAIKSLEFGRSNLYDYFMKTRLYDKKHRARYRELQKEYRVCLAQLDVMKSEEGKQKIITMIRWINLIGAWYLSNGIKRIKGSKL